MQRFDALILGGGFAGVYATQALTKALRKYGSQRRVAIIAEENHMVFQPMLPEVAGAALSPRHVVNPIRKLCRDAFVFKAEASEIDLSSRQVKLDAGPFVGRLEVEFEHLAVCVGAKIDLSRIPGMQEHALLMQNAGDAMRLRASVISRFEEANLTQDKEQKKRLLSFTVVGGGYSGVETAGQLLDLGRAICRFYRNIDFEECRFALVHSRDHLLPTLHRKLGQYTEAKLREKGLQIILKRRAKAVTANRIYLDDDETIETNTVVSTVGNAPHPLVTSLGKHEQVEIEGGCLKVGPDLACPGYQGLWSAGDCAQVPQEGGGACPPTAQFAYRQGILMGRNMAASLEGRKTKPFRFKGLGELAAIGHQTAVAELKGYQFSGLLAWFMWRTIYLGKLPGIERKLRVMFEWTLELFFPRDINLLNPRYTTGLAESYVATGDKLFEAGDPAFSFYIVKSGAIELYDGDKVVKTVVAGQHFGERALLDERRAYHLTAVAREPSTLIAVGRDVFRKVVEHDAAFSSYLKQSASSFLTAEELEALLERVPAEKLDRPASDIMSSDLIAFRREETIGDLMKRLKKRSRNHLPILDEEGKPTGVLRKESVYRMLQHRSRSLEDQLGDLPLEKLPEVKETAKVREAMELMTRASATKTLVVDEDGKLVGVLALVDVLDI